MIGVVLLSNVVGNLTDHTYKNHDAPPNSKSDKSG